MAPGGQGDAGYGTSTVPLQHRLRDRAAGIPTASDLQEPRLRRRSKEEIAEGATAAGLRPHAVRLLRLHRSLAVTLCYAEPCITCYAG